MKRPHCLLPIRNAFSHFYPVLAGVHYPEGSLLRALFSTPSGIGG